MELGGMEPGYWLLTGTLALLTGWFVKTLLSRPKNLPPGPTGLPLLGVAWQLYQGGSDPLALFSSWAKKYGEMVCFYAGHRPVVILNTVSVMVEAFRHHDLQDRPKSQILQEVIGLKNSGVALSSGEVWKEHRKFTHTVFRSLGVGKKSYEETVASEMAQLGAAVQDKKGAPFDPGDLLMNAIANVICSIIFGTQYKYDDPEFQRISHIVNLNVKLSGGGGSVIFLPLPGISKIPFGTPKHFTAAIQSLNAFIMAHIESHEKNLDPDNPRDFIDQYLNKLVETKGTDSTFSRMNLNGCIADLFLAGSDTTTTALKWGFLYMMAHPEIQSRVQDELDHVVGRDRLPRLDDRKDLPYTMAVLMEVQRKGVIAPLGVPHVAAADTTIQGYTIPKGAIILGNIWVVMNSEELWKDSDTFKPERFLTKDGQLIKRDELIFFGTGRRVCLGEQLARMELFLGFTSLLHHFTFQKPANSPPLSFEGVLGISRNPEPYMTCAVQRE